MLLGLLSQSPAMFVLWLLAVFYAITIHEYAHALAATMLGDYTARNEGRLTLNPFAHIDIMGMILLLVVGFGWGKPVPFNVYVLKKPKLYSALIGLAGPVSNLLSIVFFGLLLKVLLGGGYITPDNLLTQFLVFLLLLNSVLMLFNLIPIPPLDGSKLLLSVLPRTWDAFANFLEHYGPFIVLALVLLDNFGGLNIFGGLFSGVQSFIFKIFG